MHLARIKIVFGPKYSSIRPCRLQYSGSTTPVFGLNHWSIRPKILQYSGLNTAVFHKAKDWQGEKLGGK